MAQVTTLKNGARVLYAPMKGTDAATLLVLFHIGSRHEDLKVWGGSHFIEHLMFKGTKKRPKTIDISKELDQYGAEYNAYTGKDLTGYYVKIAADRIPVAVDLLEDMLFHSQFDATEMRKEKGVIIEEIKMYEENPIMHLEDLLEEAVFDGHELGRNIAGTAKSMMDMKRADVIAYRDRYYTPDNMIVVLAGSYSEATAKLVEKRFGAVKPSKGGRVQVPYHGKVQQGIRVRRQKKDVEQVQISLGFPIPGREHKDSAALRLMGLILGGTMSSRLFIEVREKRGLCYTVRAGMDQYEDCGIFSVRAGLDAKRMTLAMKTIVDELKRISKSGVTAAEVKMAKENVHGSMTLRLEDSSDRAEFYARQLLFRGKVESPEQRLKELMKVSAADVQRVAKEYLDFAKLSIAAIGPYATDAEILAHFPKDIVSAKKVK